MKRKTHLITFEAISDQQALILAKLGQGNRFIELETGLTSGQITYRLNKAKATEGNDHGYRVNWRNGNSPMLQRILKDYSGILAKEIEKKVVRVLVHPEPKTVVLKEI
jgi:hypothetical protein